MQMKVDVSRKFFQIELDLLKMKNVREVKPKSFFYYLCAICMEQKRIEQKRICFALGI